MLRFGRPAFWVLLAAMALTFVTTLDRLPPVVASHFDGSGAPNGWSSRGSYALLMLIVSGLVPLITVGLVHWVTRGAPALVSIPARDFWLDPRHQDEAVRRVRAYIWWLGCVLVSAGIAIHLLVVRANALQPPRLSTPGMLGLIAGVLLGIGVWAVGWYRLLRPPSGPSSPA